MACLRVFVFVRTPDAKSLLLMRTATVEVKIIRLIHPAFAAASRTLVVLFIAGRMISRS